MPARALRLKSPRGLLPPQMAQREALAPGMNSGIFLQ